MLFCRRCGQCVHIDESNFIEYVPVSGTEQRFLDCETGDVVDYGDMDTNSSGGDSEYVCPNCSYGDIAFGWSGTEDQAIHLRNMYNKNLELRHLAREKELLAETIKDSEWDLTTNEVHK